MYAGDPIKKLAAQISRRAKINKSKKIAILPFPYHDGKISSGSSIVSERLTTYLFKQNMQVVERRLIQKVLEEQKLGGTGIVDPRTAMELGKVLGVDAIVTGTLIDDVKSGKTEVNARMIHSKTGEILAAGVVKMNRHWSDRPRLPRSRARMKKEKVRTRKKETVEKKWAPAVRKESFVDEGKPLPAGKGLNLSNESFPADRRIYHSDEKRDRKKFRKAFKKENPDEGYDDGYDDGYYEAQQRNIQSQQSKNDSNKNESKSYEYKPRSKIQQQHDWQKYKMRNRIRRKR